MERIILDKVLKTDSVISYEFTVSSGLEKFFSSIPFWIEYNENVESVPDAIAAIPFVSNVLPIAWLTNSELIVNELDKSFYQCIPDVKKGYETMFPESSFLGNIIVNNILDCSRETNCKSALFYSGGLDSAQTLISHLDENPTLVVIWGSDIRYDNTEGWKLVHSAVTEASEKFNLPEVVIRSTFRQFDKENELDKSFSGQLKDNWWHGIKHGISLLGHIAPYVYLHRIDRFYIASTFCESDGFVRCASSPLTDNFVRFANCEVVHDGFCYSRQDKLYNLTEFCKRRSDDIKLHVCWESQAGSNCCRCEKCYRTIAGIIAECGNPADFGFSDVDASIKEMQCFIATKEFDYVLQKLWNQISMRMIENKSIIRKYSPYWKYVKWITKTNFLDFRTLKLPLSFRIRSKLSNFGLYKVLSKIKRKITRQDIKF